MKLRGPSLSIVLASMVRSASRLLAASLAALACGLLVTTFCRLWQDPYNPSVARISGKLPSKGLFKLMNRVIRHQASWQNKMMPPQAAAVQIAGGFLHSKALLVAVKLGLADHLHDRPMGVQELAQRAGARPDYLSRIVRALIGIGVFHEPSKGMVGNNGVSDVLRADRPGSVRDLVLHFTQESYWGAEKMYESVLESSIQPAFQLQTGGTEYWDWLDQPEHKDKRETFARAMLAVSATHNPALLADLDWERYAGKTIVDVGGGVGGFLAPLLETFPNLRGVLYDRELVIEQARELWRAEHQHLLSRVRFEAGSFFDSVPAGDVYLLRHVLHDWNSTQARKILMLVRHAMAGHNSTRPEVVIAESIMPAQPIGSLLALKDLQMLAMLDGEERSLEQFQELLLGAGFHLAAVVHTRSSLSFIIGAPS